MCACCLSSSDRHEITDGIVTVTMINMWNTLCTVGCGDLSRRYNVPYKSHMQEL